MIALKELMGHTRIETTLVYLRRKDRAKAMEQVRDLSWGLSGFESQARKAHTGFEPVFSPETLYEPLRRKLEALRTRPRQTSQWRNDERT